MTTAQDMVETARTFLGTRWKHQGREPGRNLDCVGLIIKAAHIRGLTDFDYTNYSREPNYNELVRHFEEHMDPVLPKRAIRIGDAMVFRQSKYPCHCGMVGEKNGKHTLIHAYALYRKVIEEYIEADPELLQLHVATFRYRGLEG